MSSEGLVLGVEGGALGVERGALGVEGGVLGVERGVLSTDGTAVGGRVAVGIWYFNVTVEELGVGVPERARQNVEP